MDIQDVNIILSDRSKKTLERFVVQADETIVDDLLTLGQSKIDKCWRSMWLLEKVVERHPEFLNDTFYQKISNYFLIQEDSSQLRHLLKILLMYKGKTYEGEIVDRCFTMITSIHYDAAVRVHAMQLVFNMSLIYPEFGQELKPLLEDIVEMSDKPALLSRGRRLLKKL